MRSLLWFRRYGVILVAYLGATWITDPYFMGDTVGYAKAILESRLGEFGHLLWYPLGWAVYRLLMLDGGFMVGADAQTNVVTILVAINWLAGLLGVFMLHCVTRKISQREWVANVVAITLIGSHAFLNFAQTGSAYVPGLSLLLVGIYLLVTGGERPERSSARAWGAGTILACAVGVWFPDVLSIPAALAFPLLAFGPDKRRWRFVLNGAVAFVLTSVLIYGSAAVLQGIYTAAGLKNWIVSAAHGVTSIGGIPRMALGFARSFIYMGNDGMTFKRFVLHDPLNVVSLSDVIGLWLSLSKFLLFYLLLGFMAAELLRSERGRRILGLLLLNGIPVLAFALSWQGGTPERYLPLYPVFFVSLAYCLSGDRSSPWFKIVVAAFVTIATLGNVSAMAASVLTHRQDEVVARIRDLQPLLKPQSLVATVNQQDEVWAFYWTSPFHPINRAGSLSVYHVVEPGTTQVLEWRQSFASQTFSVWAAGGDMWISKRVLSPRPRSEWYWVEGDDPRVFWADIYGFFSRLEMGRSVGGDDGFILLLSSPENIKSLNRLLGSWPATRAGATDSQPGPR
ncbi:MAG: hypothetical protein AUI47_06725 [Acidobacteria bacterium 13_1_40CM_2_68_5]|nr:MAG: hypothetical protein AUI47_06725 [Acidobacteria bacterium 13_1_40CM_2_68_5]